MDMTIEGTKLAIDTAVQQWELNWQELIFPFTLQVQDKKMPLYVHMKPYRAADLKQLLAETAYSIKFEDETSEILKSKPEKYAAFFWKHFIRISGHGETARPGDPSIEQQKQWLSDNPRFDIPNKAVLEGFGGISTKLEQAEEAASANSNGDSTLTDIFSMDLSVPQSVKLIQKLHIPEHENVEIETEHIFRRETAADFQRYERATDRQLIHRRKGSFQRAVNYDVVESLYDSLIERVNGMVLNSSPCSPDTKEKWVGLVPFWHKQLAMTQFFSGVQSKNG